MTATQKLRWIAIALTFGGILTGVIAGARLGGTTGTIVNVIFGGGGGFFGMLFWRRAHERAVVSRGATSKLSTVHRPHINEYGEFQSDKYPGCPAGKVPLSVRDPSAQDLLWEYAQRRRSVDPEFAGDLEYALARAGYPRRRA